MHFRSFSDQLEAILNYCPFQSEWIIIAGRTREVVCQSIIDLTVFYSSVDFEPENNSYPNLNWNSLMGDQCWFTSASENDVSKISLKTSDWIQVDKVMYGWVVYANQISTKFRLHSCCSTAPSTVPPVDSLSADVALSNTFQAVSAVLTNFCSPLYHSTSRLLI